MNREPLTQRVLELVPNLLSLSRIVLGVAFPWTPLEWRPWVIAVAAVSDGLDGLVARWLGLSSDTGRLLDPIADKFFVLLLAGTLLVEERIHFGWAAGIAARDLVVLAGTAVVVVRGNWSAFATMRPSWVGKCTTAAQFAVLLAAALLGQAPVWLLLATTLLSVITAVRIVKGFVRSTNTVR